MSIKRWATNRDSNERAVIEALEAQGCSVYQLDDPLDLLVGFEDRETGKRRTLLLEVKRPGGPRGGQGGTLTPNQEAFLKSWKGDLAAVVRTPDQALELIGVTNRGVEVGPRIHTSPWLDGNYDGGGQ